MTANTMADDLLAIPVAADRQAWLDAHASELGIPLVEALKAHVDQYLLADPQAALQAAETALAVAARINEPLALALAQWAKGNALIYLGEYSACVELYHAAAAVYLARGLTVEAARLQANSVFALTNLGSYAEALAAAEAARPALEQRGPTRFLGTLEQNAGIAYHHMGRHADAMASYSRARAIFAELGDPVKAAELDVNIARVLIYRDEFLSAGHRLEQARGVFVAYGQILTVARTDLNIGTLLFREGEYQAALKAYEQAHTGFAKLENAMECAVVDLYRSSVYLALNLLAEALEFAETASRVVSERKMQREFAFAVATQAAARRGLGDLAGADTLFEQAHVLWVSLGAETEAALLDLERAALRRAMGRQAAAVELLERTLPLLERAAMPLRSTQALLLMAQCKLDLMQTDAAECLFQAALERLAGREVAVLTYRAYDGLGRIAQLRGQLDQAASHFQVAVQALAMLQDGLLVDELRAGFLDDKQQVYQSYVQVLLDLGDAEGAFKLAMRAKSGVLLDAVADSSRVDTPNSSEAALWEEVRRLKAEWQWQFGKLRGSEQRGEETDEQTEDTSRASRGAVGERLHAIEVRSKALWWALQQHRRSDGRLRTWETPSLANIQAQISGADVLVEYYEAGEHLMAFVVTHQALHVVTAFPASVREIERSLAVLELTLKSLGSRDVTPEVESACRRHLAWFYQVVLQPLAHLIEGSRRVMIAPCGPLHYLPFAALYDGTHYLVETAEVMMLPSAGLTGGHGRKWSYSAAEHVPTTTALVMGCSAEGQLLHVQDEIAVVASVLPNSIVVTEEAATYARLRVESRGCRLLHLAAHGVFRGDNPLFSYLQLADGPLRLLDIYSLQLDAELVVLSACETGVNRARGGDVVGLCRGFMQAGAQSLVVTLWRVDDATTASIMAAFYSSLAAGDSPPASLRAAQLAVMAQHPHPFFWAPFVVISAGTAKPRLQT